jgi:hypothetical protein
LAAQATPAGKNQFRRVNPPAQKFTKTDLAKYVLSWDQRPAVVSRGAQKCFVEFMNQVEREGRKPPEEDEFKRLVGQAILFHTVMRLYGDMKFKGDYRAQIITYSISRFSYALQRRMRWDDVWERQAVPEDLIPPLKLVLTGVRDVILHTPGKGNIGEWCKREECWSAVLQLQLQLGLQEPDDRQGPEPVDQKLAKATPEELAAVELVRSVPSEVWYAVSKWAKETGSLQGWQRSIAYSLGLVGDRQRTPSPKQGVQGCRLLLEARRLGFGHGQLTGEVLERLGKTAKNR